MLHSRVEEGRKHKSDAKMLHTLGHLLCVQVDLHSEGFKYVRAPATAAHRSVAVLCNGHSSSGSYDGCRRGDVERTGSVAACTARINYLILTDFNRRCSASHHSCQACDFVHSLTFHSQCDQQRADLRGRSGTIHNLLHRLSSLCIGQGLPLHQLVNCFYDHFCFPFLILGRRSTVDSTDPELKTKRPRPNEGTRADTCLRNSGFSRCHPCSAHDVPHSTGT